MTRRPTRDRMGREGTNSEHCKRSTYVHASPLKGANMATRTKNTNTTVPLSNVVQSVASKRDADATKIGKQVRSYIRGHDADLRKAFKWPPNDKQRADGNRYPPMPRECADSLIAHFTRQSS
jgi:hypothetical protein